MNSVDDLLRSSELPPREARALLRHVLDVPSAWVLAHGGERVCEARSARAAALFARRRAGEPLAYVTGEREFYGASLRVSPEVLIPRSETELVVDEALAGLAGRSRPRVLDLGTGSGAIAVAIARARPDAQVWASDVCAAALAVARENAARYGLPVRFLHSDWFDAIGCERFDLIACNPPYVASADPHLRRGEPRFEPRAALDGGPDGMDCVRRVAAEAREHLAPGGWLVLEHGYDQGPRCLRLLGSLGFGDVSSVRDLAGWPRVCRARFDAKAAER